MDYKWWGPDVLLREVQKTPGCRRSAGCCGSGAMRDGGGLGTGGAGVEDRLSAEDFDGDGDDGAAPNTETEGDEVNIMQRGGRGDGGK